jgi:hypothetical protein
MSDQRALQKHLIENLKKEAEELGITLQEYLLFTLLERTDRDILPGMDKSMRKLSGIKNILLDVRDDLYDLYNSRTDQLDDIETTLSNIEDNTER